MTPVAKKATPAAIAVLRQATALKPKRKKASDGLLPSPAHLKQSPSSDHNTGYAVDLTHDPVFGISGDDVFFELRKDKRVKYLIFKGHIWTPDKGVHKYEGSNQHTKHVHISIKDGYGNDTSPWFGWIDKPKVKVKPLGSYYNRAKIAVTKLKPLPKKKANNETKTI